MTYSTTRFFWVFLPRGWLEPSNSFWSMESGDFLQLPNLLVFLLHKQCMKYLAIKDLFIWIQWLMVAKKWNICIFYYCVILKYPTHRLFHLNLTVSLHLLFNLHKVEIFHWNTTKLGNHATIFNDLTYSILYSVSTLQFEFVRFVWFII
jgi:hypothetical protein